MIERGHLYFDWAQEASPGPSCGLNRGLSARIAFPYYGGAFLSPHVLPTIESVSRLRVRCTVVGKDVGLQQLWRECT